MFSFRGASLPDPLTRGFGPGPYCSYSPHTSQTALAIWAYMSPQSLLLAPPLDVLYNCEKNGQTYAKMSRKCHAI